MTTLLSLSRGRGRNEPIILLSYSYFSIKEKKVKSVNKPTQRSSYQIETICEHVT